jgi:hypothetical protein
MLLDAVILRLHPNCESFIGHLTDTLHPRVLRLHREREEYRILLTSEGGPRRAEGEEGTLI